MNRVSLSRRQLVCPLEAITFPAPHHTELVLYAPFIARHCKPGQFVHILGRPVQNSDPFLRRAFSIKAVQNDSIHILFRVEGRVTAWLSERNVGESLDILGPLGNGFAIPCNETIVSHESPSLPPHHFLVGGGIGVPPLIFLARHLIGQTGTAPVFIIGARNVEQVIGVDDLSQLGIVPQIATDDGSLGLHGRVTDLLAPLLDKMGAAYAQKATVFACGPWPMLRAIALLCRQLQVPCQVSLEENMPCGIGVCNGCVVKCLASPAETPATAMESQSGWTIPSAYNEYRRVCVDGPAIWADQVNWEHDD